MRIPEHKQLDDLRAYASEGKLLLLDDDVDFCDVLQSLLEAHRYEVTVVHRGADGIREIMNSNFDAIICDMMMPTMRGDMFYLAVRQLKPHLCARFIFVTAHRGNPHLDSFLRIAAGEVIYKPLATDILLNKIADIKAVTGMRIRRLPAKTPLESPQLSDVRTPIALAFSEREPASNLTPNLYDPHYFIWKKDGTSEAPPASNPEEPS
jgi:CheY-like chemotaxis protein